MQTFKALVLTKGEKAPRPNWSELSEADLMDGDVTVRVSHSTLNYKDGLAHDRQAPVVRRWPMVAGIDFAGTVTASSPRRLPSRATRSC